jgi:hypothetical protein
LGALFKVRIKVDLLKSTPMLPKKGGKKGGTIMDKGQGEDQRHLRAINQW